MRRIAASLLCCLLVGACASCPVPDPKIVTQRIEVPVPVACKPDIGPEPAFPDSDQAIRDAPDLFARTRLLLAGRLMRIARAQVESAALQACAG